MGLLRYQGVSCGLDQLQDGIVPAPTVPGCGVAGAAVLPWVTFSYLLLSSLIGVTPLLALATWADNTSPLCINGPISAPVPGDGWAKAALIWVPSDGPVGAEGAADGGGPALGVPGGLFSAPGASAALDIGGGSLAAATGPTGAPPIAVGPTVERMGIAPGPITGPSVGPMAASGLIPTTLDVPTSSGPTTGPVTASLVAAPTSAEGGIFAIWEAFYSWINRSKLPRLEADKVSWYIRLI